MQILKHLLVIIKGLLYFLTGITFYIVDVFSAYSDRLQIDIERFIMAIE